MASYLTENFVEKRIHTLKQFHKGWNIDPPRQHYYELDLKMCQIKMLCYKFEWGDEKTSVSRYAIASPSRILRLSLSLNELTALEHEGLKPFRYLRELDASLNRINNFMGIEHLKYLHSLNLSHNFIKNVDNLINSISIVDLNLSMNEIDDISYMPSLPSLEILNLNNNKISNLDGIQSLPRLKELYIKHNQLTSITPLTSCLQVQILNAADNHIAALQDTVDIIAQLKRLQVLNLDGNPLSHEHQYQQSFLKETNVMTLDSVTVRTLPKYKTVGQSDSSKHDHNIMSLKNAAEQAFQERIKESSMKMEKNISYFQKKIVDCQNEHGEFEQKMHNDLKACLRHLDSLTSSESENVDRQSVMETSRSPSKQQWKQQSPKLDYRDVRHTDEVLRNVCNELAKRDSDV